MWAGIYQQILGSKQQDSDVTNKILGWWNHERWALTSFNQQKDWRWIIYKWWMFHPHAGVFTQIPGLGERMNSLVEDKKSSSPSVILSLLLSDYHCPISIPWLLNCCHYPVNIPWLSHDYPMIIPWWSSNQSLTGPSSDGPPAICCDYPII